MSEKTVTLVVPCYNEERTIPVFYGTVKEVLDSDCDIDYRILFVNDGSTDHTLEEMKKLSTLDSRVQYISFSRNFGKEAALFAGLRNAEGDYVGVMDVDLQDPPSLIPEMISALESGEYDCAAARRVNRKGEPKVRSFFARCFYRLSNKISDVNLVEGARDFRIMKREMVDAVISLSENNRFSKGLFEWVGFRTKWLSYNNVERSAGKTKWSFFKLVKYSMDGIASFSEFPLLLSSFAGILSMAAAFIMLLFVFFRRLIFGDPVAGWASTICIILFISGLQFMIMGIMGQYIAKTYIESKNRPHYIITETNCEKCDKIK